MARSVVLRGTARCPHCRMAPRWCVCAGARAVGLPFAADVLMHHGEAWKPSSTGSLIGRIVPGSRRVIYHNQRPPCREDVARDGDGREGKGRALWILHPRGDALGDVLRGQDAAAVFAGLRVLLIDGTWSQANDMLRHIDQWGQKVSLPASALPGGSRYWLRTQHGEGHFSTIEALIALLHALGCASECARLREQFELHVYASLLARGRKILAEQFLVDSPIREAMPEVVGGLQAGG